MADNYNDENMNEDDDISGESDDQESEDTEDHSSHILVKYSEDANIADSIDELELMKIGFKVITGFEDDKISHRKWLDNVEEAQKLSQLKKEPKNVPLPQSANIKYPMITDACTQFAARTYPIIIENGKAVNYEIIGSDPDGSLQEQADRLQDHMNYTLLGPDSSWEASLDKLLVVYPNTGFALKKTYWDPTKRKIESVLCGFKDIIIRNEDDIHELSDLRRITHMLHCHANDLVENARYGVYCEDAVNDVITRIGETASDQVIVLLEQHRFLDLDEDGYEEPYIVTVVKDTSKVLRIVARYTEDDIEFDPNNKNKVRCIKPIQYFTDFHFLPASDGRFMSVGYGTLMLHLNETVNTILNQLIDAGSLANLQGGFMDSRLKFAGGQLYQDPGQWNKVKAVTGQALKDGILPISYKEPSTVLFQLLGMLIQAGKDLTASTDALEGSMGGTNVPATTMLALVEQGLKKFSSIQKRLYRSLKSEYEKIARLNKMYLDEQEYMAIAGGNNTIYRKDYETNAIRLIPIADPNISSDTQRMAQSQVLGSLVGKGLNDKEIFRQILQSAKIKGIEKIVPADDAPQPPDPKIMQIQAHTQTKTQEIAIKAAHQKLKEQEFAAKQPKQQAEIQQMQANSVKLVSEAGKNQADSDHQTANLHLNAIKTKLDATAQAHQQATDATLASQRMALDAQDQAHQQNVDRVTLQQAQQAVDQGAKEDAQQGTDQPMGQTSSDSGTSGNPPEA